MALRQNPDNQVVFGTTQPNGQLRAVTKALYKPSREPGPDTHHYIRNLESAVLQGQAIVRLVQQLRDKGFVPDLVYGHSGWGPTLYIKDVLPKARLHCYFEWFYNAIGSDADFDPSDPLDLNAFARIRTKNAPILIDLVSCDAGLSPTQWQRQQFPPELQSKIQVMHDGVDTDYFKPTPNYKLILPEALLDLSAAKEVVTYVGRGMEPYRGFPQFIETVHILQKRRPDCHFVIVGEDRVAYGKKLPEGQSYKQLMLEKFPLDPERTHFTGRLPYDDYRKVLWASDVHVYLTRPFVLSWSMLEAMAAGCLLVASDTQPVKEVIRDGENGLLVDFFSPQKIADRVEEALDNRDIMQTLRANARETIVQTYNLKTLLPQHVDWVMSAQSS